MVTGVTEVKGQPILFVSSLSRGEEPEKSKRLNSDNQATSDCSLERASFGPLGVEP
jgi:hypothetical protein